MALLGGGEVGGLRFLDHRADPVDLGLLRERPADRRDDLVEAFERHRPRVDRPPARRLLGQPRDVEIAIGGHHQGARDRRGAHQQGVGVAALCRERQALLDAKAVLLVDDDEREIAEFDIGLQQRVGPDDDRGQAGGEARQHRGARPALLAAGQEADLDICRRGVALQGRVMLAGEDLGRRHQRRLAAGLDRAQHRQQRHHGLAAADIALQQAHHALRLRHVGGDLGDRQTLRPGQRKAERRFDAGRQRARADDRPALGAMAARPHQRHRELAGEHLVIGEALARRVGRQEIGLGRRRMDMADGLGPGRPCAALGEGRVDPFGQLGSAVECRRHRALHDPRGESCGQRVDRLDRLQPVELVGPQDEVGVGDLGRPVVELDPAADHPLGADRQQARKVVALDVEIGQGQPPGRVGADHPVGPGTMAVIGVVRLDAHRDGHDLVGAQLADRRRGAPVDDAARQMPQQVDDERSGEALEELGELRADAGKRGDGCEERIEDGGTHKGSLYRCSGTAKTTT